MDAEQEQKQQEPVQTPEEIMAAKQTKFSLPKGSGRADAELELRREIRYE